jgi:hypothetical protein
LLEYINVKQAAPHRTGTQLGTGDGSIDLTTVAAGAVLVDCAFLSSGGANRSTPGANQNERLDVSGAGGAAYVSDKLPAGHSGVRLAHGSCPARGAAPRSLWVYHLATLGSAPHAAGGELATPEGAPAAA